MNNTPAQPIVTVVTPFYNTSKYLRECIVSVINQSYANFEYILHDNNSDDGSSEIALGYAAKDPRIKYYKSNKFLSQVQNYNEAVKVSNKSSKYIKFVQADDWLYPECLRKMIQMIELNEKVGLVSSYYLKGNVVQGNGLEIGQTVVSGNYACNLHLRKGYFMFGSPTSVLYRREAVKHRVKLYDEGRLHEDTELIYDILKDWEFGFIHEILSYLRVDYESISGSVMNYNPQALDKFIIVNKYGSYFLKDEYDSYFKAIRKKYYNDLAEGTVSCHAKAFLKYHLAGLSSSNIRLDHKQLLLSIVWMMVDLVFNPKKTLSRIYRCFMKN